MFKEFRNFYSLLGRKFLTLKRISKIISVQFLTLGIFAGVLLPSAGVYANTQTLNQVSTAQFTAIETTTLAGAQSPVATDYSISQYFSGYHPGLDLAAPEGTAVYPIAGGIVKTINRWFWGYGTHIFIDHGDNFVSLYAHLSTVEVKVGDKVEKTTLIGRVGSTGWATGNHLHLEIRQNDNPINPLEVLGEK
ncbi:MAG: M23 family metallopeptidase [bacterium]|nr:M23 family metallopeptidase [bacterium]